MLTLGVVVKTLPRTTQVIDHLFHSFFVPVVKWTTVRVMDSELSTKCVVASLRVVSMQIELVIYRAPTLIQLNQISFLITSIIT
jgi:hypothetical protein